MQVRHVTVYRDASRYAGWPANYGIWSWKPDGPVEPNVSVVPDKDVGDEIVVGFTLGYPDPGGGFHRRDKNRPFVTMQARSLDGGQTWQAQACPCRTPGGQGLLSADEHVVNGLRNKRALDESSADALRDCPGGIDFAHPDFALMCARTGLGAGTRAWFYTSIDRCHTWDGPWKLPMFGQAGVEARTDYLVSGSNECTLFLTASKPTGGEGDHVFSARTTDGGASFQYLARISGDYGSGFAIMPASVRLSASRLLVAVRCRGERGEFTEAQHWIDLYASDDGGATWRYLNRPAPDTGQGGNPPAMIRLQDGRVCLTYGYRAAPYGLRARLSADGGETWGDEIVLRDDGGNHDIGYPRTVQRADGTIVTAYYYNDHPDGERYIAATLWKP